MQAVRTLVKGVLVTLTFSLTFSLTPAIADPALDLAELEASLNGEQQIPVDEVPPEDRAEICPEIIVNDGDVED